MSTMADKQSKRTRRSFSEEFKAGAVRLVLEEGKTVGAAARDLDLTESSLRNWVEHARADRTKGTTGLTTAEREELARLRKELRIVQEEREILKKWSWATTHPRRNESDRLRGAMRPGQGRRLLVPPSPGKNGPECCAPGTPHCCPRPTRDEEHAR
jgi:transposase